MIARVFFIQLHDFQIRIKGSKTEYLSVHIGLSACMIELIEFTIVTTDKYYIVVTSSIFSPNPAYDMIIDVSTPTTTTTTTTTTSTTDTSTTTTTTTSDENPFKIPGYPFLVVLGVVIFGVVAIISRRKIHK